MLTLELFDTGYCVVPTHQVLRGGSDEPMECHALVGLIGHPQHGLTLFDTGYTQHMVDATRRWPYSLYPKMTPLRLDPKLEIVRQLQARGVDTASIRRVIVSHFHADHVAGLLDFPTAAIVASQAALAWLPGRRGFGALLRGYLPDLTPADLSRRAQPLQSFNGPELPGLGPSHDFFGDGSLLFVQLPGHARGQIGALVETNDGPVLLAADGAWTSRSIRERIPPARMTYLIVDDARAMLRTIDALHAFSLARPDVRIIPTHCPEVYTALFGRS